MKKIINQIKEKRDAEYKKEYKSNPSFKFKCLPNYEEIQKIVKLSATILLKLNKHQKA